MKLNSKTISILEDIERRIDPETEENFKSQWEDFLYDRFEGKIFRPLRAKRSAAECELPNLNINDAVDNYELMLVSELVKVSKALGSNGSSLAMRANYGTGILSSILGAEIFVMPRENNTLPTTKPFNDTAKIEALVEKGIPNLCGGFGRNVLEFGELCAEVFAKYPKIGKYVSVYHPDLQGPLDICELMWGGEMFYSMYDEPELVHAALSLVTDTYTAFLNKWYEIFPSNSHMNPHWNSLWHRGKILLRCDSAMNLSPDLYKEFAAPYDGMLLERFDGGAMHFCGRGDHYIEALCNIPKLYAINMGQPDHNDMEKIFKNSVDKGIKILGFTKQSYEKFKDRPVGYNHSLHVSW